MFCLLIKFSLLILEGWRTAWRICPQGVKTRMGASVRGVEVYQKFVHLSV